MCSESKRLSICMATPGARSPGSLCSFKNSKMVVMVGSKNLIFAAITVHCRYKKILSLSLEGGLNDISSVNARPMWCSVLPASPRSHDGHPSCKQQMQLFSKGLLFAPFFFFFLKEIQAEISLSEIIIE